MSGRLPGHGPKSFQLLCSTAETKANLLIWQNTIEAHVSNTHHETELTERDGDCWNAKDAIRMSKKSEIFTAHIKIFRYKDTCTLFSLIPLITFTMVKFFKGLSFFFFCLHARERNVNTCLMMHFLDVCSAEMHNWVTLLLNKLSRTAEIWSRYF